MQRAKLKYLRSRAIKSTPIRFKDSEDNWIHKMVLLSYKVGALAAQRGIERDPGGSGHVVSDGLLHTTIRWRRGTPSQKPNFFGGHP